MSTYKQVENSSIYPLSVQGNCYFIAKKFGTIGQNVDVGRFSKFIDSGQASSTISGHFGCSQAHQNDEAVMYLGYLDVASLSIASGSGSILEYVSLTGNVLLLFL
jgi:hypothetical protein